jgi:hypothetical protein
MDNAKVTIADAVVEKMSFTIANKCALLLVLNAIRRIVQRKNEFVAWSWL